MNSTNNDWHISPLEAFKTFVQTVEFVETSQRLTDRGQIGPISKQSALTYTLMFGKFIRWLEQKQKTIFSVTHDDLLEFLALRNKKKRDLNSKIAYRYLRLIERCYVHLQIQPNPAQHAIFNAIRQQIGKDKEMVVLNNDQFQKFIRALPLHSTKYPSNQPFAGWKQRRDRAMQLVMLCAGLRVSEVIDMQIDAIDSHTATLDGSVKLCISTKPKYDRTTYLRVGAVPEVLAWLDERKTMNIPGMLLFPASLEGQSLDKATVYRQVNATFKRAGIAVMRTGGRTLRNTFAAQELKSGSTTQELTQHLGLALERSVQTYVIAESKT